MTNSFAWITNEYAGKKTVTMYSFEPNSAQIASKISWWWMKWSRRMPEKCPNHDTYDLSMSVLWIIPRHTSMNNKSIILHKNRNVAVHQQRNSILDSKRNYPKLPWTEHCETKKSSNIMHTPNWNTHTHTGESSEMLQLECWRSGTKNVWRFTPTKSNSQRRMVQNVSFIWG